MKAAGCTVGTTSFKPLSGGTERLRDAKDNVAMGSQSVKTILSALIALLAFFMSPLEAEENRFKLLQPQDNKRSEIIRFDSLLSSPASRKFMEVGIEFARCDALFFSIYNGFDTKGFEVDPKMVAMVDRLFVMSYPDQVNWLAFYDGLIGFDRQYEMWYEYGDEYDYYGYNQIRLFSLFSLGAVMTELLENSISSETPKAHFNLFLSRREEALRTALITSTARHADVHSKMLECIDLASFWGLDPLIEEMVNSQKYQEKFNNASFSDSVEHVQNNVALFMELEICSQEPLFDAKGFSTDGPCGDWMERVRIQESLSFQLGGAHKHHQISEGNHFSGVDLSMGDGTFIKSTVSRPDPYVIERCTADAVRFAGEALLNNNVPYFRHVAENIISPCNRELAKMREAPGLEKVRIVRGTSVLLFSHPSTSVGKKMLALAHMHPSPVELRFAGKPAFFQ